MTTELADAAKLVTGGGLFTIGGRMLYMLDTATDRWLIPVFKTDAERDAVARLSAHFGANTDGECLITDGAAWLDSISWSWEGKPVQVVTDFTVDGLSIYGTHTSRIKAAKAPAGWEGWVMRDGGVEAEDGR